MGGDALIVFAKWPEPGRVKTRLTPALTPKQAARLYEAFLRDGLAQYAGLEADVRLYLAPPLPAGPTALLPPDVSLHPQQGPDLGARMLRAFVETFGAGYERAVLIGTDHPSLPTDFIELAFAALETPLSLCIGPSEDGGYYLLGMNDLFPQLFDGMTYSHEDVFAQTLDRAGATRAHVSVLPEWYDVDTPEALRRLVADLAATTSGARRTRDVLDALTARYPSLARGAASG